MHANRIHPWYIKSSRTYVGSLGSIQPFIHVSRGAVERASHRPRRIYSSSGLDGSSLAPFKLIIYSKDECPLCDKLKDKVRAILDRANFATSSPFTGIELEIRNIKSNAQWEAAYSLSIPVLAYETLNDNVEVCMYVCMCVTTRV